MWNIWISYSQDLLVLQSCKLRPKCQWPCKRAVPKGTYHKRYARGTPKPGRRNSPGSQKGDVSRRTPKLEGRKTRVQVYSQVQGEKYLCCIIAWHLWTQGMFCLFLSWSNTIFCLPKRCYRQNCKAVVVFKERGVLCYANKRKHISQARCGG